MVSAISSYSVSSPTSIFTAKNAVKAVGGILLFSGVAVGTGRLLQLGGAKALSSPVWGEAGRAAMVAGDKLFLLGKGAFLSVSVPFYTITYVVPNWIVNVGMPIAGAFAHETFNTVIIPGAEKVAQFTAEMYRDVLTPLGQMLANAGQELYQSMLVWVWTAVQTIAEATVALKILLEKTGAAAYQALILSMSESSFPEEWKEWL